MNLSNILIGIVLVIAGLLVLNYDMNNDGMVLVIKSIIGIGFVGFGIFFVWSSR